MTNVTNEEIMLQLKVLTKEMDYRNRMNDDSMSDFAIRIASLSSKIDSAMTQLKMLSDRLDSRTNSIERDVIRLPNMVTTILSDKCDRLAKAVNVQNERSKAWSDQASESMKQIVSILENACEDQMRDPSIDDQPDGGLPLYVEESRKK